MRSLTTALVALAFWPVAARSDPPLPTDKLEHATRRLVQLDVSISGPRQSVADLGPADFELTLGRKPIRELFVDNFCGTPPQPPVPGTSSPPQATSPPEQPTRMSASYLFYFDQDHLTLEGRARAIELARTLTRRLVHHGARGSLVSSGRELVTLVDFTDAAPRLLAAIDRLERDIRQVGDFAQLEDARVQDVYHAIEGECLTQNDPRGIECIRHLQNGRARAIEHSKEERARTERALRRFAFVLQRFVDVAPPKVVMYFGDTLRANAGEHYRRLFMGNLADAGHGPDTLDGVLQDRLEQGGLASTGPFDRLVRTADAEGVRLYTVLARGASLPSSTVTGAPMNYRGFEPLPAARRVAEVEDSLRDLAAETGGRAFVHGESAAAIGDGIEHDVSCLYLLSFDPSDLTQDRVLSVALRSTRPGVRLQTRGQLVIPSEASRSRSRLLAAEVSHGARAGRSELDTRLIPTGYERHHFRALVQISLPDMPLPAAEWEVGAAVVARGRLGERRSRHLSLSPAGAAVFETEMEIAPGAYEVVLLAQETTLDEVAAARLEGAWPDPHDGPAIVGTIALLQPVDGVFVRDGDARRRGARACAPGEPVRV
ncbi:MAG TPA: hypothetical protein VJS92_11000, partial [Candidatus Polarisedimenticolaceae bacterium]|nr:hypothetical protein [Candidatus Polarisedimenticolaceae bacterium]